MLPNLTDLREIKGSLRWFFGRGPRPSYGRWTYWEKFDYFAVFWGVAMIGMTGLLLWLPEVFTRILPGPVLNVATIIHSDEALLAVGFIFTIHFFNSHLRPEKFPMDTVIFTGRASEEEMHEDRPAEVQRLSQAATLEFHEAVPEADWVRPFGKAVGTVAVVLGLVLVVLIVYAVLF
jgi:cytochrome b subunit of formate dehydrogenase